MKPCRAMLAVVYYCTAGLGAGAIESLLGAATDLEGAMVEAAAAATASGTTRISTPGSTPIKHVVVLYLENRGFDHVLGFAAKKLKTQRRINGLMGNESNPLSLSDPGQGRLSILKGSPLVATMDPKCVAPPSRFGVVPPLTLLPAKSATVCQRTT